MSEVDKMMAGMTGEVGEVPITPEMQRAILKAQEVHQHAIDQLQLIADPTDKGFQLAPPDGGEPVLVEPGTETHAGIRAGVAMALTMVREFPIQLTYNGGDDD